MAPFAVILDVDGTLVDSNDAHAQTWVDAFNEAGIDVSSERVRRAIGMGGDKLMPHVAGIHEDSREGSRISKRRGEIFRERYLPHLSAFPRVRDLVLRFTEDGYTVVVASSAQSEELSVLLKIAGISDLIAAASSSTEAKRSKPDPDIVHAALQRSGAPAEQAIMLGDTPYDVEAALRAGIAIVGVESGGWGPDDLRNAVEVHPGAAAICANYGESAFARLIRAGRLTSRTS
jgi:phosphoglycolate phosphatase-like HAD superfamily hydrolase